MRILLTGVGQRNAENAIRHALAGQPPKLVLTCGFAGGLNPDLATGTVVFSIDQELTDAVNPPPAPPPGGSEISDASAHLASPEGSGVGSIAQNAPGQSRLLALALEAAGGRAATIHCAGRVVSKAEEKRALRKLTGADAVEMESGIIRAICREHNIPSATVRVISDPANEDLPLDFNLVLDAGQNLRRGKLALALAKSPGKIGALLQLRRQTRKAAERLAQVLTKAIGDLRR